MMKTLSPKDWVAGMPLIDYCGETALVLRRTVEDNGWIVGEPNIEYTIRDGYDGAFRPATYVGLNRTPELRDPPERAVRVSASKESAGAAYIGKEYTVTATEFLAVDGHGYSLHDAACHFAPLVDLPAEVPVPDDVCEGCEQEFHAASGCTAATAEEPVPPDGEEHLESRRYRRRQEEDQALEASTPKEPAVPDGASQCRTGVLDYGSYCHTDPDDLWQRQDVGLCAMLYVMSGTMGADVDPCEPCALQVDAYEARKTALEGRCDHRWRDNCPWCRGRLPSIGERP
jgi:hypothetical protein